VGETFTGLQVGKSSLAVLSRLKLLPHGPQLHDFPTAGLQGDRRLTHDLENPYLPPTRVNQARMLAGLFCTTQPCTGTDQHPASPADKHQQDTQSETSKATRPTVSHVNGLPRPQGQMCSNKPPDKIHSKLPDAKQHSTDNGGTTTTNERTQHTPTNHDPILDNKKCGRLSVVGQVPKSIP
jgi:hypothetical protein